MCRKLSTKLCPNRNLVRAMHPLTAPPYFIHVSSMFHFLKIANQRLSVRREQHRPDHAPTISFFTIAISTPYPDSLVKGPLHAPSLPSSIRSQSPHPTPPPNHQSHQPPLILQTQTALPPRNRPLHYQPPPFQHPCLLPSLHYTTHKSTPSPTNPELQPPSLPLTKPFRLTSHENILHWHHTILPLPYPQQHHPPSWGSPLTKGEPRLCNPKAREHTEPASALPGVVQEDSITPHPSHFPPPPLLPAGDGRLQIPVMQPAVRFSCRLRCAARGLWESIVDGRGGMG